MDIKETNHYRIIRWHLREDIEGAWLSGVSEISIVANWPHHRNIITNIAFYIEARFGTYDAFCKGLGKNMDSGLAKLYKEYANKLYPGDKLYESSECQCLAFYNEWSKSKTISYGNK